jgi:hypothetical protein
LLLCTALAACGPTLAARFAAGSAALATNEGAADLVVISPILQDALNTCIPPGTPGASKVLVVVADIDVSGIPQDLDVEPSSRGTTCLAQRLAARPLPKPPLAAGASTFPVGLKIENR